MSIILSVVAGALYALGIYLVMRRGLTQIVIGLAILSNAANLTIFTASGLTPDRPPLVPVGATEPVPPFADPIPQALILTAIVIGFGVLAFALVLIARTYQAVGSDDVDEIKTTDE